MNFILGVNIKSIFFFNIKCAWKREKQKISMNKWGKRNESDAERGKKLKEKDGQAGRRTDKSECHKERGGE